MERPMQYEYSNEPEDEDEEDEDSATEERNYVNELILQRSRNRHPAFSDDHDQQDSRTTSTTPTSSMQTSIYFICYLFIYLSRQVQ